MADRTEDLIKMNSLGFSLSTIAAELDVHITTVSSRLVKLGIPPADTRRTFMEDIYQNMPPDQLEWLADQLGPHLSVKDYVKNLLTKEFLKTRLPKAA